eukprot:6123310-Pyramimonas_sp.AAC.1
MPSVLGNISVISDATRAILTASFCAAVIFTVTKLQSLSCRNCVDSAPSASSSAVSSDRSRS